jgi:hypothetical protein
MLLDAETPMTPDWALLRLGRALRAREDKKLGTWWRYYKGDHPLPRGPRKATQAYLDFQRMSRTNFTALPVDAAVHRMEQLGVVDENGDNIPDAWKWYKLNHLDAKMKQVYRTSFALSESYLMVGPHPRKTLDNGRPVPLITPEHPRQVIVETDPATGERLIALKAYYDSINRVGKALVFIKDVGWFEYQTDQRGPQSRLPWGAGNWERRTDHPIENYRVPIVPFTCQPDMAEDPEPLFAKIIDIQDRINLTVLNRMTAERYSAFRQKHVTGHKFKKEIDPATGLETITNPFVPDPGAVWASEGAQTQFGEFSQTDLMGYLKTSEHDIRTAFVLTHTPAYYMPGDLINIATDTVVALDTNHVSMVQEHQANFGESSEEVYSLAGEIAGSDVNFDTAEVRWKDPRQLNPAVVADMGTKKISMGYPLPLVAEDMGESPARVGRLRQEVARQRLLSQTPTQLPNNNPAGGSINGSSGTANPPVPGGAGSATG